jgi:hypothetical protein
LRAGFPPGDLTLKVLLARRNIFQRQTNPLRPFSTVYQKRRWTFTTGDLGHKLLNLWPRRGPFLPEN